MSVLRDQNFLAVSPAEQVAALINYCSPHDAVGLPFGLLFIVTDDMCISLADDIIEHTAFL